MLTACYSMGFKQVTKQYGQITYVNLLGDVPRTIGGVHPELVAIDGH